MTREQWLLAWRYQRIVTRDAGDDGGCTRIPKSVTYRHQLIASEAFGARCMRDALAIRHGWRTARYSWPRNRGAEYTAGLILNHVISYGM